MGTWQKRVDPFATQYLSTALKNLRKNLANPSRASNQATIATIFLLATHEVCKSLVYNNVDNRSSMLRQHDGELIYVGQQS